MRRDDGMVHISSEDTHCFVRCICEKLWEAEQLSIGDHCVTRCRKCGRGYRTEFSVFVYNPDEKDAVYLDYDEWKEDMEESHEKYKELRNEG